MYLWGGGVVIITKWSILTPGHIAILCGTFSELKQMTNYGPSGPLFITEILQRISEVMETFYKHIIFVNMEICFEIFLENPCTDSSKYTNTN